jgi:pimeloyl-ACP methyl ester carboxylesterase
MPRSSPVDGFRLAYERAGAGPAVVVLHGWPGDRGDYRVVVPLLRDRADLVVPDLRGFGDSDKHPEDPATAYGAAAQARSVLGLVDELGLEAPVVAGYDVGSRVAQAIAATAPDRIHALVLGPPLPGAGERVLTAEAQREFWYQAFHQLDLAAELIDGKPAAVRAYLRHFWDHWSGAAYRLPDADLERLVQAYGAPGAFTASIAWYRAGAGMVAQSLTELPPERAIKIHAATDVLWPQHDPLFPREWADRLEDYFVDARLHLVDGVGHFTPLECPEEFAGLIRRAA